MRTRSHEQLCLSAMSEPQPSLRGMYAVAFCSRKAAPCAGAPIGAGVLNVPLGAVLAGWDPPISTARSDTE